MANLAAILPTYNSFLLQFFTQIRENQALKMQTQTRVSYSYANLENKYSPFVQLKLLNCDPFCVIKLHKLMNDRSQFISVLLSLTVYQLLSCRRSIIKSNHVHQIIVQTDQQASIKCAVLLSRRAKDRNRTNANNQWERPRFNCRNGGNCQLGQGESWSGNTSIRW